MGAFESSDAMEYMPPQPPRSTLFVVRNGRYEPQNLMPVLPRSDILDFDGFVVRRGAGAGCMNARPPEMRQERLLKNPVSIRRDSARTSVPKFDRSAEGKNDSEILSFIFDAQRGGQLSVQLLVREAEKPLIKKLDSRDNLNDVEETNEEVRHSKRNGEPIPKTIELLPQVVPEDFSETAPVALEVETRSFSPGLGQCFESSPIDLSRWPAERLVFDTKRPKDIPIAVRMETEPEEGEPQSIHYTYISLQGRSDAVDNVYNSLSKPGGAKEVESPSHEHSSTRGVAQIFEQKLQ
jgi:hypothetical protein